MTEPVSTAQAASDLGVDRQLVSLLLVLGDALADRLHALQEQYVDQSPSSLAVLATVSDVPPPQVAALAVQVGMSRPGVSRAVDRLVAAGLLGREYCDDHRSTRPVITALGQDRVRALREHRQRLVTGLLAGTSPTQQRALLLLLGPLLDRLVATAAVPQQLCRNCDRLACGSPCVVASAAGRQQVRLRAAATS